MRGRHVKRRRKGLRQCCGGKARTGDRPVRVGGEVDIAAGTAGEEDAAQVRDRHPCPLGQQPADGFIFADMLLRPRTTQQRRIDVRLLRDECDLDDDAALPQTGSSPDDPLDIGRKVLVGARRPVILLGREQPAGTSDDDPLSPFLEQRQGDGVEHVDRAILDRQFVLVAALDGRGQATVDVVVSRIGAKHRGAHFVGCEHVGAHAAAPDEEHQHYPGIDESGHVSHRDT